MALFEVNESDKKFYEEMMACKRACRRLELGKKDVEQIFYGTAARVFGIK